MSERTNSKSQQVLVVAGMTALLFAAGVAFAALEARLSTQSVSTPAEHQAIAVSVDPRDNPDDCLYEPPTPSAPMVPGNTAGTDAASVSPAGAGPAAGSASAPAEAAKKTSQSADTPEPSRDPQSGGDKGNDSMPPKSPHQREQESSCPAF